MKNIIAAVLVLALFQMEAHGWQDQHQSTAGEQVQVEQARAAAKTADELVLHKGLPLCMLATENVSTQTAKVGDPVKFRIGNELSVEGLTVAPKGSEVTAMVSKVKKPRNWLRDGELAFALNDLKLINGQTVPVQARRVPKYNVWTDPDGEIAFWLVVLAPITVPMMIHDKGDDGVQAPAVCLHAEIAQDVRVNRAEIAGLQRDEILSGEKNWKTRLRELLPQPMVLDTSFHDLGTAQEIMELNLITGRERRLGKCKHCFSPVTCDKCGMASSNGFDVYFIDKWGIYNLYADDQEDGKNYGRYGIVAGRFTRILAIDKDASKGVFADIAVLQSSANSCKILRVSRPLGPGEIVDSIDCKEVVDDASRSGHIALRPAQILDMKYLTDVSAAPGVRTVAVGSLDGTAASQATLVENLDNSYSRFDPVWRDATRILYVRERRETAQEKH